MPIVRSRRLRAAVALLALAAGTLAAGGAAPAGAATPSATATGLTWRISEHAWTNASLNVHAAEAPATISDDGFTFGEAEVEAYHAGTGALEVRFPGAMRIGNQVRGNYHISFADPVVAVDEEGDGDLSADVSYGLWDAASSTHVWSTPVRATIADFTLADDDVTVVDDVVAFTVTPDFALRTDLAENPDGWRQFPQPLIDALAPAVPSLLGHFQETGSAADATKAPAPLSVSFPLDVDAPFVESLYRILLGRGVSEADLRYWTGRLDGGTSRAAVADSIARSPEGRAGLVHTAYQRTLLRSADQAGLRFWTGRLAAGLTPETLVTSLITSPEARARVGDATGFAQELYAVHLFRSGSPADVAYWAGRGASAHTATTFGRLPEATTAMVRFVAQVLCGTTPDAGRAAELGQRWTSHRGDTSRLIGATVALVCPGDAQLPPV